MKKEMSDKKTLVRNERSNWYQKQSTIKPTSKVRIILNYFHIDTVEVFRSTLTFWYIDYSW